MHDWNYHEHMRWMGWMPIWWSLGAVLTMVVVWTLLGTKRDSTNGHSDTPEENLKRRYAKGEVDQETYQRMLTDLKR